MGNQHAFGRTLHEDGGIGEKEITMGCPKITSGKLRGLIVVAERLREIDNCCRGNIPILLRWFPTEVAQAREVQFMSNM